MTIFNQPQGRVINANSGPVVRLLAIGVLRVLSSDPRLFLGSPG